MTARGYRVTVVAGRRRWCIPRHGVLEVNEQPVHVIWLPYPPTRELGAALFLLIGLLYLLVNVRRFSVVHVLSIKPVPAIMAWAAFILRRGVVCRSIGGDVQIVADMLKRPSKAMAWYGNWLRQMPHVVAQTEENARAMRDLGMSPGGIVEIPNGVDTDHFEPDGSRRRLLRKQAGLLETDFLICSVSQFRPEKRVDVAVSAFGKLTARHPNSRLYLVGNGQAEIELRRLVNELGVSDKVIFTGLISDPQPYLQMADAYVLTSDEVAHSNSLLEAMACGLPVFATAVGGNRITIEHGRTGFLVPAGAPDDRAEALLQLRGDPDAANQLGRAARQVIIEKFGIDQMITRYEQLYALALADKK